VADAVLLLGFGGPEGPDDVLPFLRQVTAGRDIPDERLAEVGTHYQLFGGVSPINAQNRALLAALRPALDEAGIELPLYWGNRNWHPFVGDTMAQMASDGIEHAVVLATSAYSSYSSCRQYQEDLDRSVETTGPNAPSWTKVRPFFNHPGFVEPMIELTRAALREIPEGEQIELVFTAHSIPTSMAERCDYAEQLTEVARIVTEAVGFGPDASRLVYQSRSGPPQVPWLEPDICDSIEALAEASDADVHPVVIPIGFISDHMEVLYDLDTEAADLCSDLGIPMTRVPTVGTHPTFVRALVELIDECVSAATPSTLGRLGPRPVPCVQGCCPAPVRRRP